MEVKASPVSERSTVVALLLLTFATGLADATSLHADVAFGGPCGDLSPRVTARVGRDAWQCACLCTRLQNRATAAARLAPVASPSGLAGVTRLMIFQSSDVARAAGLGRAPLKANRITAPACARVTEDA